MENNFSDMLKKYGTARIDIKNIGNSDNHITLLKSMSDYVKIYQPSWFNNTEGIGTVIECYGGSADIEFKCENSGILKIWLRGLDYRDKNGNSFPIYIDYTDLEINNQKVLKDNIVTWHDKPYIFKKAVENSEKLKIHIEWLPFNNNTSEYFIKNLYFGQTNQIESLNEKILIREKQLESIPQLSATSFGTETLNGKLVYRNWIGLRSTRSIMNDFNGFCEYQWFTRYLNHKFPNEDFKIYMTSVFNAHDNITYPTEGKKVLYSAEDLNYRFIEMKLRFDKFALDYVDFAMGYDLIDHPKYLRFPYWLTTHFPPNVTDEIIEDTVISWNTQNYEKTKNITAIASHDIWKTRTLIANDVSSIVNIDYGGGWRNNTPELHGKFKNNKREFLKQYKFNICPENLFSNAYVTEKLFDAIHCDCIPLYAGGGNYLEPKVINPKAIIRWDADADITLNYERRRQGFYGYDTFEDVKWVANDDRNSDAIELFKNLLTDEKSYKEFKDQNKVLDSSSKFIIKKFKKLEKHFERIIYN